MTPFEDIIWLFSSNTKSRGIARLNIAEGALLYRTCREYKDATMLEIGRKHGGSTVVMASALDRGELYSIDTVKHQEALTNASRWKDKIHFITGDSKHVKWEKQLGVLFIDGDHSYEGVRNDINNFTPFVMPGGVVIFHDVVGKKSILQPLIQKLQKGGWIELVRADSMLVMKRSKK